VVFIANHLTDTDKHYWKIHKLNTTQKNQNWFNHPGSIASCDSWPGNDKGLLYNAPEPTHRNSSVNKSYTYTDTLLTCVNLDKHCTHPQMQPSSLPIVV